MAAGPEPRRRPFWRRRDALGWLATSIIIPLLLLSAATYYDHYETVGRARERVQSTADSLAENAHIVLETAALTLNLQLNAVRGMSWEQIGASRPVHDFLAGLTEQLPQLESAFFVDPQGRNSASSRRFPMPPIDDSGRDYFQALGRGDDGLYVSAPVRGALNRDIGVVVSQARMTNGHADGLAAVTLSPGYFRSFYEMILDRDDQGAAALVRTDGTVLFRYPAAEIAAAAPANSETMALISAGKPAAVFSDRSPIDGELKLVAFRRIPGQDIAAVYGTDWSAILAAWYRHIAIFAGFALVASGALLVAGLRAIRHAEQDKQNLHVLLGETERRQMAEAALQQSAKMEALGRLTGGVAHDFNNLLAAVLGSLELAGRRTQDPQIRRVLSVAEQAAKRGAKLTAQMLAFARKREIEPQPVAVNGLIRGSDELLRRTAGSLIKLHFKLDETIGAVMADPVQLELALLNLVANARDAMAEGGELTIATARVAARETRPPESGTLPLVAISVADTGTGMPEDVRARVFEPFYTTKALGSGTGLGLSMIYGFARQMGGTATVESAPGRGTTVRLWLPETELGPALAEVPALAVAGEDRRLRILLVDDDPMVRISALEMLRELGHHVTAAADGRQALDILGGEAEFELLIADYAMPGMDGSELAEAALKLRPALPVVFISGYVANDALRRWTARGFRTVAKPFNLADLAAALRDLGPRRDTAGEDARLKTATATE